MIYRPRPPRKGFFSYIAPFLLIVLIFVGGVYSFKRLLFSSGNENSSSSFFNDSYGVLNSEKGPSEVLLSGTTDWKVSPAKIKLFKGDAVKTSKDGLEITFPNGITLDLDSNSSLSIDKIESDNSYRDISITLNSGRLWINAERMINPKSKLTITFQNLSLTTRGGIFSVEANAIRALNGDATIDLLEGNKAIGHTNIGIGQELILGDTGLSDAKMGRMPEVNAISDEFKLSSWYKQNFTSGNNQVVEDNPVLNAVKETQISSGGTQSGSSLTGSSSIGSSTGLSAQVSGTGSSVGSGTEIPKQEKSTLIGEITPDLKDGDIVEVKKDEMYSITGKCSKNISSIKINGYKLGKFRMGSDTFKYNTMIIWGNLAEGENVALIEAFDNENKKITEKQVKFIVKIKVDEPKTEDKSSNTGGITSTGSSKSSTDSSNESGNSVQNAVQDVGGVLQIISPKEGEVVNTEVVEIKGIAPAGAISVYVGKYKLQKFKSGDKEFAYNASVGWGNLKAGEKNTFFIKALDADGNIIESINLSFFVEKKSE